MAGEPGGDEIEKFVSHLLGLQPTPAKLDGATPKVHKPSHWLKQTVQLRNNQRSIEGTIPAFMWQQVGMDKHDPPEVDVYFDPHTQLVIFDLPDTVGDGL